MSRLDEGRKELFEYALKLSDTKLVFGTWGNISLRLCDKYYLITPSGIDYKELTPELFVRVRISDGAYFGDIKPSSESKMHTLIYRNRKDINAIVHTHSTNLQILSTIRKPFVVGEKVIYPVSKYAPSSTKKLALNVAKEFEDYNGVIMANHGFVVGAKSLEEALNIASETEIQAGVLLGEK